MIWIADHTRNHDTTTPDEMLHFIHKLDYEYVDVRADVFPAADAIISPKKAVEVSRGLLEKYNLTPSEYLPGALQVDGISYRPLELTGNKLDKACSYFDKICVYAKKVGFTCIRGGTGEMCDELGYEKSLELTTTSLTKIAQVAIDNGLAFNLKPSKHSRLLDTPQKAHDMAKNVPNLTYTLDLLHYVEPGFTTDECLRLLLQFTNHVNARQTAVGWGKCPIEYNEIDYDMMIRRMRGQHWSGVIAIEWKLMPSQAVAKMSAVEECIVMRYELKKLIRKYYADLLIP